MAHPELSDVVFHQLLILHGEELREIAPCAPHGGSVDPVSHPACLPTLVAGTVVRFTAGSVNFIATQPQSPMAHVGGRCATRLQPLLATHAGRLPSRSWCSGSATSRTPYRVRSEASSGLAGCPQACSRQVHGYRTSRRWPSGLLQVFAYQRM